MRAILLMLFACGDDPAPAESGSTSADTGAEDASVPIDTGEPFQPAEIGTFSVEGVAKGLFDDTPVSELCVDAYATFTRLTDDDAAPLASATTDADGAYQLDGLQITDTGGLMLVAGACDDDTWQTTATTYGSDTFAALPDGAMVSDLDVWVITSEERETLAAALTLAGAAYDWATEGGVIGHIRHDDDEPFEEARMRVPADPEDLMTLFQRADDWFQYGGTTLDGAGFYAVPGAPYAAWVAAVNGYDFLPVMTGGIPGWAFTTHFVPIAERDLPSGEGG